MSKASDIIENVQTLGLLSRDTLSFYRSCAPVQIDAFPAEGRHIFKYADGSCIELYGNGFSYAVPASGLRSYPKELTLADPWEYAQ